MGLLNVEDPLYEAFRRDDQYGDLGWKRQGWPELLRLVLAGILLVPLKVFGIFYFVFSFYLVCRLSFLIRDLETRAKYVSKVGCFCAKMCCHVMGFHVNWEEVQPGGQKRRIYHGAYGEDVPVGAVVSNHVSYLDILILTSRYFPSFVARSNTAEMPLLGVCSKHLNCIFVDRDFKKHGEVKGAAAQVKARMTAVANGTGLRPVLLFPEGTTTSGRLVLPFHTGAFLAGVPLQPCFIKYKTYRISPAWDSIDAFWHGFLILAQPTHSVTVYLLPIYTPTKEEQADPKLYSANVRNMLMRVGGFGDSQANLNDCRAYISLLKGKKPSPKSRAGKEWEEKYGDAPNLKSIQKKK